MENKNTNTINYIDLFSGIGGFHLAMNKYNGKCVFSAEINKPAVSTYQKNFNMDSYNDVTKIKPEDLPDYDLMCAGFPCQSFSKAGNQKGFEENRGTLFFDMLRMLKYRVDNHNPVKYILFENVRNLITHDNKNTYNVIMSNLHKLGYITNNEPIIASPHHLNIPQLRERTFILGIHESFIKNKSKINLNVKFSNKKHITSAYSILNKYRVPNKYYISDYENKVLTAWDEFYKGIKEKVIGFPIWSVYFNRKSNYHEPNSTEYPNWKQTFIKKNLELYDNNKTFIDGWLKKYNYLNDFVRTHTKFEWQCGNNCSSIWEGLIQFRPSGIRVKRPTEFPALVAMVHIPIIGKHKRRITPSEVAQLQSFPDDFIIHNNDKEAYKQFGNSVNVKVVKFMINKLLSIKTK
jgi:DNA (cytosine-5)-methyltransferase 1